MGEIVGGVARKQGKHAPHVFVASHAEDDAQTAATLRPQLRRQVLPGADVVPRVANDGRRLSEGFPAAAQAGRGLHLGQSGTHVVSAEAHAGTAELAQSRKQRVHVPFLISAGKAAADGAERARLEPPLVRGVTADGEDFGRVLGENEGCPDAGSRVGEDGARLGRGLAYDGRRAGLEDAGFLAGDSRQRMAEKLRVVEADVRHDGKHGLHDVRTVQPPAQTDLDDGNIDRGVGKILERHGRGQFEKGRTKRLKETSLARYEVDDVGFGHRHAVYPDTLAEVDQVGRGIEPDAIAGGLEHGGDGVRTRTLAVGATDVYGQVFPMGMSEVRVQRPGGLEPLLVGPGADLLEQGGTGVEVTQRLVVRHYSK